MTPRGPLNYTTVIDPMKSATECIGMLAIHGATAIGLTSDGGVPTGLSFQILTPWGKRQFTMPVNVKGVEQALGRAHREGRIPLRFTGREQAQRVAWRVLKDWLEVELALIDAGVADMVQVMLPYVNVEPGKTLFEAYGEQQLAIGAGETMVD
jgi:hypothetical protein